MVTSSPYLAPIIYLYNTYMYFPPGLIKNHQRIQFNAKHQTLPKVPGAALSYAMEDRVFSRHSRITLY